MIISRLNLLIWLPVYIMLLGCRQYSMDEPNGLAVIDVVNNLGKYQAIPVCEFVIEFEYIPLETGNDCLIGEGDINLIITSTHIFVQGGTYCYAFSRAGRFISKIGSFGQGPGEYTNLINMSIDEITQSLYLETFRTLLEYSWDGKFHRAIQKPPTPTGYLVQSFFVRDSFFISHDPNHYGNAMYNFQLFNESGQVFKSFDNPVRFNPAHPGNVLTNSAMKPFRMAERIYVKELWNDTLYYLDAQNELVPQFVFDLGKYALNKEKRTVPMSSGDDVVMNLFDGVIRIPAHQQPMVGTPNHIFFSLLVVDASTFNISFPEQLKRKMAIPAESQFLRFVDGCRPLGIYDIVNQKTRLLNTDRITRMSGLINDLDGGLSFWPKYYTSDNKLIDIWQAYEMKELLTEEYFAAHEIKDIQAHQKLKELLKNLDEYDNPVVVIAKLKK